MCLCGLADSTMSIVPININLDDVNSAITLTSLADNILTIDSIDSIHSMTTIRDTTESSHSREVTLVDYLKGKLCSDVWKFFIRSADKKYANCKSCL